MKIQNEPLWTSHDKIVRVDQPEYKCPLAYISEECYFIITKHAWTLKSFSIFNEWKLYQQNTTFLTFHTTLNNKQK